MQKVAKHYQIHYDVCKELILCTFDIFIMMCDYHLFFMLLNYTNF